MSNTITKFTMKIVPTLMKCAKVSVLDLRSSCLKISCTVQKDTWLNLSKKWARSRLSSKPGNESDNIGSDLPLVLLVPLAAAKLLRLDGAEHRQVQQSQLWTTLEPQQGGERVVSQTCDARSSGWIWSGSREEGDWRPEWPGRLRKERTHLRLINSKLAIFLHFTKAFGVLRAPRMPSPVKIISHFYPLAT